MNVSNPYEVLGVSPSATDDEIKTAYRNLAKKYHPDNFQSDTAAAELAQEKMQQINEAYDAVIRMRRGNGAAGNAGTRYADIRRMIQSRRLHDAEMLLDGIPDHARDAEWYYLKATVLYQKGWLEDAYTHMATACRMDPGNAEYRGAMDRMTAQRQRGSQPGGYTARNPGCSSCDICSGLLCADCCCECMGGDLIPCC
jgi:molecular chaperone DnaJ